jgi:hypothetical protein
MFLHSGLDARRADIPAFFFCTVGFNARCADILFFICIVGLMQDVLIYLLDAAPEAVQALCSEVVV